MLGYHVNNVFQSATLASTALCSVKKAAKKAAKKILKKQVKKGVKKAFGKHSYLNASS